MAWNMDIWNLIRRRIGRILRPWLIRQRQADDSIAFDATNGQVIDGPFRGMRYVGQSGGSALGPKLLGTYEMELRPVVDAIIRSACPMIIDIGAGEGYYAIGLLTRMPLAQVEAFESSAQSRHLLGSMARRNQVCDRLTIHGACAVEDLSALAGSALQSVVICDCEGGEAELLDPVVVTWLTIAPILVETHDMYCPGVTELLLARFAETHHIETFHSVPRDVSDAPASFRDYPHGLLRRLLSERRKEQTTWLWMMPKTCDTQPRGVFS